MWRWWIAAGLSALTAGCGGKSSLPREGSGGAAAVAGSTTSAPEPGPLTAQLREARAYVYQAHSSPEAAIEIDAELVLDNEAGQVTREVDVLQQSLLVFRGDVEQLYENPDLASPIIVPAGQRLVHAYERLIDASHALPGPIFCTDEDEYEVDVGIDIELSIQVLGEDTLTVEDSTDDDVDCD